MAFCVVTVLLAIVRCVWPDVAKSHKPKNTNDALVDKLNEESTGEIIHLSSLGTPLMSNPIYQSQEGVQRKNKIYSVSNYGKSFPDLNDVQLISAQQWGIPPEVLRENDDALAEHMVFVGNNMYYKVDNLRNSSPYLVPRAAVLLQDIGKVFFDSLQMKGLPLHRILVTSIYRSTDDLMRLRNKNGNASANSCHQYGTTFDIAYNRYQTVEYPGGDVRRRVRNDSLKYILAEVLNDFRRSGRCHVKYEVKQGCFHITTR